MINNGITYLNIEGRGINNFMAVYPRNGKWYIDYYYEGVRRREIVGPVLVTTKRIAEQALAIRKAEIAQGRFQFTQKNHDLKMKEYIERYWEWAKCNQRHPEKWTRVYLNHFLEYFRDKRLSQITPKDIEEYKILRSKEIKPSTINRELACLKRMYSLAVNWGYANSNPVKKVKFFREDTTKERILTLEEETKLILACCDHVLQIVVVALNTGMRIGEILNLEWNQLDLKNRVIIVEHTKNGKIRKIPINSTLRNLFVNARILGKYVFGNGINPYGSIKKGFHAAIRRAGIPHLRFHDLRHTFATRLVSNGIDLATVKELLGHSTIMMTMRYTHPTPEHKINAVESLVLKEKWTPNGHQEKMVPLATSVS